MAKSHGILDSDREENISDINTSNESLWFSISTTHTSLETISSSTGQHFVDAGNVVGMFTDTEMEAVLKIYISLC